MRVAINCLKLMIEQLKVFLNSSFITMRMSLSNNKVKKSFISLLYQPLCMYNIVQSCEEECKWNSLPVTLLSHRYSTRNKNLYKFTFPRVNVTRRKFHWQFMNVWNDLPDQLNSARTVKCFRKQLTNITYMCIRSVV